MTATDDFQDIYNRKQGKAEKPNLSMTTYFCRFQKTFLPGVHLNFFQGTLFIWKHIEKESNFFIL